ncbi:MAG: type IV secretory system conjugative DNA transfer family protein [Oscillospiraceae bacterium]|nr:type IV secretory system conjugative DNA transfer family protein [Oscillospiraceae bacterium]
MKDNRKNYQGQHILAQGVLSDTDTWTTGINNNVLVFGPTGAGKTRHYVKPNILNAHESMIISDTKGSLYEELRPALMKKGYRVLNIDFTDLSSGFGYNPLDYIRYNEQTDSYSEQDILTLADCLVESRRSNDPFWDLAAKQYLEVLIGYVLEALPEEEHDLRYVVKAFNMMKTDTFKDMMRELQVMKPNSTTWLRFKAMEDNTKADRTDACIRAILAANLDSLVFDEALALYGKLNRVKFEDLGRKKTAVFLTVSDTDRSLDRLANAFITQALQALCRSADKDYPDHRLDIPVRFYLDDFATNVTIPDFDRIISVIRSREIYVSVVLQSITQLTSLYGDACAKTILNNCDQMLYLGGQDLETAGLVSEKSNKSLYTILSMPLDDAFLFIRGQEPRLVHKYEVSEQASETETVSKTVHRDQTERPYDYFEDEPFL